MAPQPKQSAGSGSQKDSRAKERIMDAEAMLQACDVTGFAFERQ